MKKRIFILIFALLLGITLVGCNKDKPSEPINEKTKEEIEREKFVNSKIDALKLIADLKQNVEIFQANQYEILSPKEFVAKFAQYKDVITEENTILVAEKEGNILFAKAKKDAKKLAEAITKVVKTEYVNNKSDLVYAKTFQSFLDMATGELPKVNGAFYSKDGVKLILIPQKLREKLISFVLTENVKELTSGMFKDAKELTTIIGLENIQVIPYEAFLNAEKLANFTLSENITAIGKNAFAGTQAITQFTFNNIMTEISDGVFKNSTGLANVTLGDKIEKIGNDAFNGTVIEEIDTKNVTTIGKQAFANNEKLSKVILGSKLESIGEGAFLNATALDSITIPSSTSTIGKDAFKGAPLTTLTIDNAEVAKALTPEYMAEKGIASKVIYIKDTATDIGSGMTASNKYYSLTSDLEGYKEFIYSETPIEPDDLLDRIVSNHELAKKFYLESNYPDVKYYPFAQFKLTTMKVKGRDKIEAMTGIKGVVTKQRTKFSTYATYLSLKDGADHKAMLEVLNKLDPWVKWDYDATHNVIHQHMSDSSYYVLNNGAAGVEEKADAYYTKDMKTLLKVKDNKIKTFNVPAGVTKIGAGAFQVCEELTTVNYPDSVTEFGESSFYWTKALTSFTIKPNVKIIGPHAFDKSALESIVIPDTVTELGEKAFYYTPLKTVTIGAGITEIGKTAFGKCKQLENIIIPGTVKTIGVQAFTGCSSLKSATLNEGVEVIGDYAFSSSSKLKTVTVPTTLKTIGKAAFTYSSSAVVDLSKTVLESIGDVAFYGTKMTSVVLPDTLKTLGKSVFKKSKLKSLTIGGSVESIGETILLDAKDFTTLTIKSAKVAKIATGAEDGDLLNTCKTLYVLAGISDLSTYINDNFVKETLSDKVGYNKYSVKQVIG